MDKMALFSMDFWFHHWRNIQNRYSKQKVIVKTKEWGRRWSFRTQEYSMLNWVLYRLQSMKLLIINNVLYSFVKDGTNSLKYILLPPSKLIKIIQYKNYWVKNSELFRKLKPSKCFIYIRWSFSSSVILMEGCVNSFQMLHVLVQLWKITAQKCFYVAVTRRADSSMF